MPVIPIPTIPEMKESLGTKYLNAIEKHLIKKGINNESGNPYKINHIAKIVKGERNGEAVILEIHRLLNEKASYQKSLRNKIKRLTESRNRIKQVE